MGAPGPGFATFRISVSDGGTIQTYERQFATWGLGVQDLTPAWEQIGDRLLADFEENQISEGQLLAGGWAPLKASTIRQRIKLGFSAGPIMWRTGRLGMSLAYRGAAGNVFEVGPDHITIGTDVEYARYQHFGAPSRNLPARKLVGLSWESRSYALRAIADLVRERAMQAGFDVTGGEDTL